MIIARVYYTALPGKREAFVKRLFDEGLPQASRAEEGNISYEYGFDPENPDGVLLMERWKDNDAVLKHQTMPHFKRTGEVKAEYIAKTEIQKYLAEPTK